MRLIFQKLILLLLLFSTLSLSEAAAQKLPKCIKVAKTHRPNWLSIDSGKLTRFYKNFGEEVAFSSMKLVKSELAFYLIAQEREGSLVYAFELEQKGKRLFLNKFYPVQTCDQGDLSLDTFLQTDGKIEGCRKGKHNLRQLEKKKP